MNGRFYGDSSVKPFMVVRVAKSVQFAARGDRSGQWIRGRGVASVRASARTNFYPCRMQAFGTTCNIRAKCAGKPLLPARPIFGNGHVAVTRSRFGRDDL